MGHARSGCVISCYFLITLNGTKDKIGYCQRLRNSVPKHNDQTVLNGAPSERNGTTISFLLFIPLLYKLCSSSIQFFQFDKCVGKRGLRVFKFSFVYERMAGFWIIILFFFFFFFCIIMNYLSIFLNTKNFSNLLSWKNL